MKCLIVLSLLCIAANAYTDTDDDVLVEKLLKRYEEHQERKRTVIGACLVWVNVIFSGYVLDEDETGNVRDDLEAMVEACVQSGSPGIARGRLADCVQHAVNDATGTKKRSMSLFARDPPTGNCATAAADLSKVLIYTAPNTEATIEQICNMKGSVHKTIQALASCVDPNKEPNPP